MPFKRRAALMLAGLLAVTPSFAGAQKRVAGFIEPMPTARLKQLFPAAVAFTPRGEKVVHINISNVPPTLRNKFAAKAKRTGQSQRNLVLGWIKNWVENRRPDEGKPEEGAPWSPDLARAEEGA